MVAARSVSRRAPVGQQSGLWYRDQGADKGAVRKTQGPPRKEEEPEESEESPPRQSRSGETDPLDLELPATVAGSRSRGSETTTVRANLNDPVGAAKEAWDEEPEFGGVEGAVGGVGVAVAKPLPKLEKVAEDQSVRAKVPRHPPKQPPLRRPGGGHRGGAGGAGRGRGSGTSSADERVSEHGLFLEALN